MDSTSELIRYYAQKEDILMVHMEEDGDDFLQLGQFLKASSKSFLFRWINTEAEWEDDTLRLLKKCITRITFGSEYDLVFARHVRDPHDGTGK